MNGAKIPATADPTRLVLEQHDEIALVYGTPPDKIPSSYQLSRRRVVLPVAGVAKLARRG